MEAWHAEEYRKMMKKHEEIDNLGAANRKRTGDGDGTQQLKLIGNNNHQIVIDNRMDPQVTVQVG